MRIIILNKSKRVIKKRLYKQYEMKQMEVWLGLVLKEIDRTLFLDLPLPMSEQVVFINRGSKSGWSENDTAPEIAQL